MLRIKEEYAIAYKQVLVILNYIPLDDYRKIPIEKIKFYRKAAKKDYKFEYNPEKTLKEQGVSNITEVIIAGLYRDYWATDKQREQIKNCQNFVRKRLEDQRNEKYNLDNIFKQRESKIDTYDGGDIPSTQIAEIRKDSFMKKIINKIKSLLKRTNYQ